METLSTLATFDELRRCETVLSDGTAEIEFHRFAQMQEQNRLNWLNVVHEAQRLQRELDACLQNVSSLETKLYHARRLLEMESKARKEAELVRDGMEKKIWHVQDLLRSEQGIKEETRDKFAFLNSCQKKRRSRRIPEKYENDINSTGSFLSDLSVTHSEEDFLDRPQVRKHRASTDNNNMSMMQSKRSRISTDAKHKKATNNNHIIEMNSNDKIVASTRVSIPQGNGPITAESVIEAVPQCIPEEDSSSGHTRNDFISTPSVFSKKEFTPTAPPNEDHFRYIQTNVKSSQITGRQHTFVPRTFLKTDICYHCSKKINFGSISVKCKDCKICVHNSCKSLLNVACIPQSSTPTVKGTVGFISDYAPSEAPRIPAIIVHCINEIEMRGLTEVGIYRVSGSEKDIKALKERFIRGKTIPSLANIDVHVLCGCIKDFLRNLREPLIPTALWREFSNAAQNMSDSESMQELYTAINNLPSANRDTLAFLMQHFLRVASSVEIKMPKVNIAKIFGPTIVGYSSAEPDTHAIYTETTIQAKVVEKLLEIPNEYWSMYLTADPTDDYQEDNHAPCSKYNLGATPTFNSARKRPYYCTPPYSAKKK